MKVRVKLTQIREGYVDIDCVDIRDALRKADELYNGQGKELPDMEDAGPVQITFDSYLMQKENLQAASEFSREMVEKYLQRHGYPHPEQYQIDFYLEECPFHEQRKESVVNDYDFCDADRWFHVLDILKVPVSFPAAMLIENSLWTEDLEILEFSDPANLIDTPQGLLKERIEALANCVAAGGSVQELENDLTEQDVDTLVSIFKPWLSNLPARYAAEQEQKASLSALIQSAENRAASSAPSPEKNNPSFEL